MQVAWVVLIGAVLLSTLHPSTAFLGITSCSLLRSIQWAVADRRDCCNSGGRCQPVSSRKQWSSVHHLRASSGDGDGWMFASVRGDESNRNAFDIGLIAPPFGDVLVVGKTYELQFSKVSEQMLLKKTHASGEDIAYGVGLASTSGSFANSQNFVAGAAVSRLRVLSIREDKSGRDAGMSCSVAVVGRVLIKEVKHMRPYFVVSCFSMQDSDVREELLGPTNDLKVEIEQKFTFCLELQRKISEKKMQARLRTLAKGNFLLNIPDDQLLELTRSSKSEKSPAKELSQSEAQEGSKSGAFEEALLLQEQLEAALSAMSADEEAVSPTRRFEVFSFLALSGAGAGREELGVAMQSTDVRERMCRSIELLDEELTRLRTEALLADFGA